MRAIVVRSFGGPPELAETPAPVPSSREVLVHMEAAGVNPFDRKMADGILDGKLPHDFPMILGVDGAGSVAAIGDEVTQFAVGQRVVGKFLNKPVGHGSFAEFSTAPQDGILVPIPDDIPTITAAALPTAAVTAQDIIDSATPKQGQVMLVVGATGGVGSFLVQLANLTGAYVIATARDDAADRMVRLGAAETIDYRREPLGTGIARRHPEGVDILVDLVDPAAELSKLSAVVRNGGLVYSTIGAADEKELAERAIGGGNIQSTGRAPELARLLQTVAEGDVVVPIEHAVPLREAASLVAGELPDGTSARGKTVVTI